MSVRHSTCSIRLMLYRRPLEYSAGERQSNWNPSSAFPVAEMAVFTTSDEPKQLKTTLYGEIRVLDVQMYFFRLRPTR